MALQVGSRLGHYNVTALIGEGGMGQVYQATDTTLNRQVALKILPEAFADDPDRLARFQREAQVLASLNHPNIAAIHGLEDSEGTRALVLELVEGPTLADRIAHGPIPVDEALPIAKQIAEALEAAHEQGIIHRDLKPANIKVKDDGTVKVLDFGLAKALDTTPQGDPSQSPTLTAAATQMGVIMGTAAYMSPEQAVGKPVDKRSDIWSFGVVLWEMLTGQRLFSGETVSHVLAKILESAPDLDALPPRAPSAIRLLLRRCLEKDRKERLQHVGDARVEIAEVLDPQKRIDAVTRVSNKSNGWQRALLYLIGVVSGGLVAGLLLWDLEPTQAPMTGAVRRVEVPLAKPGEVLAAYTSERYGHPSLALSPDGVHLVYVVVRDGQTQLFLRRMDEFEPRALPSTEGGFGPFFSPDGQWVGFFTATQLKKISIRGGEAFVISSATNPTGASWGSDDEIIFADTFGKGLSRVSADGGEPTVLATPNIAQGEFVFQWPQVLPGGRGVLVTADTPTDTSQILVVSLETGERRVVVERGHFARYLPTGHLIFADDGGVLAAPFDLSTLTLTGSAVPVLDDVLRGRDAVAQLTFSAEGTLAYVPGDDMGVVSLVWVDRNSPQASVPVPLPPDRYATFSLSPDGRRVALQINRITSDVHIYDFELATPPIRLTTEGNNGFPAWTPDGRSVTYWSDSVDPDHQAPGRLFQQAAEGSQPELLSTAPAPGVPIPYSWSQEGALAFETIRPETGSDVWVKPSEDSAQPISVAQSAAEEWGPAFSPDGHWIAYSSNARGQFQVYVDRYPGTGRPLQVSTDSGENPIWSPKGDELFYRRGNQWLSARVETGVDFRHAPPEVLFEGPYINVGGTDYAVSPDGERFLLLKAREQHQTMGVRIVFNWFEELQRLVPVN